ncbi:MAG: serine protease [Acidobacteriota bacterium]
MKKRIKKILPVGTGFFVAKNGVALAAAHCLPDKSKLEGKELCAGVSWGRKVRPCQVAASTVVGGLDIAIIKVKTPQQVRYLPLSFQALRPGTDVLAVGIPDHGVWGNGREIRVLKGYITYGKGSRLALSFSIPKGMSGSPLFVGEKVAGVLSGSLRSEELEDRVEEVVEESDREKVTRTIEVRAVVTYGLTEEIYPLRDFQHEVSRGQKFSEFLDHLNA